MITEALGLDEPFEIAFKLSDGRVESQDYTMEVQYDFGVPNVV